MWAAGILRGHSDQCPHRIAKVHHTMPAPLMQSSNPDFPCLTHAVTMAVSLDQVQNMIIEAHAALSPVSSVRHGDFAHFTGTLPDTVLWMWHFCRAGIAVSIRGGQVALFVPFCNPHYQNSWSARAIHALPPVGLPGRRWWANGWLLCGDQVSEQLCSDTGVCAIMNMIMVSCSSGTMHDCDFVINRRDSACVRRDGRDAMNPLDPYQVPMSVPPLAPILSPYVGDQFADIAMPLASDWHRLSRGSFAAQKPIPPVVLPRDVDWHAKKDCIIFRGALTGTGSHPGTHQRLALMQYHDGHDFDFCGTGRNQRLRYCPIEKRLVMPDSRYADVGKHNYIDLPLQQESYRYSAVVDGHSGADRLAALCSGHQVVFKVDSPWHALCPETWTSQRLHAWEHYIPVSRSLSNLSRHLAWARQHDDACQRIRQNCKQWAKTERKQIIQWWLTASSSMGGASS